MHLLDWVEGIVDEMNEFRCWYMKQHDQDPMQYPINIDAGEWDEQFKVWGSM